MSYGSNGSVIGPENAPTTSAASGVWSLGELAEARRDEIWPMPPEDYEVISRYVADGTADSVTFSSVPQNYRSLRVVLENGDRASAAAAMGINYNSDATATNYDWISMFSGSTDTSYGSSHGHGDFTPGGGSDEVPQGSGFCYWMADIEGYANSSVGTQAQIRYGARQTNSMNHGYFGLNYGVASAVTTLKLVSSSTGSNYYFAAPTVITLFGIGST